jgi:RNA polymerase sigma factor (sigma-70 family)
MLNSVTNPDLFLENTQSSKELLYKHFAPRMYGICMRFGGSKMEADDILHEGFIRVFTKIHDFRREGSLEGWIRRTIINTAINYNRWNSRHSKMSELDNLELPGDHYNVVYDNISKDELLELIQELPSGYRTVFNLNVIEGYTHKEIGELLNISDNTSKSQLNRARLLLQKKILLRRMESVHVPFECLTVVKSDFTEKCIPEVENWREAV